MKRSQEIGSAAPSDDCVMTSVVTADQYASGSRASRAISTDSTAATAVRTECTKIGHPVDFAHSLHLDL